LAFSHFYWEKVDWIGYKLGMIRKTSLLDPVVKFLSSTICLGILLSIANAEETEKEKEKAPMPTKYETAIIETSEGTMKVELWNDVAPKTVENFKKLSNDKFYDGTAFHRIIKGFMIQGGDPLSKQEGHPMVGTGDPGYKIKAEFNDRKHVRGVLSMARAQDPDSAGCQFFICLGDAAFLDNKYTAFGKVIEGDDVLGKIGDTPVGPSSGGEPSKPKKRVEVKSIRSEAAK
jgi:peptidyl-prolyl cis-trans isomerase B (cyclophilin B)